MEPLFKELHYPALNKYKFKRYLSLIDDIDTNSREFDKEVLKISHPITLENIKKSLPSKGRFLIDCGSPFPTDTLFIPSSENSAPYLFVTLSGARSRSVLEANFNRWSYYTYLNGHMLSFLDPMLSKYPDLLLGWFYGTESFNLLAQLAEIIETFAKSLNIDNQHIIFWSSSGGGSAALYLTAIIQGSSCLVYNPQIFLEEWPYAPEFTSITGIDLKKKDIFHRNNVAALMRQNTTSNFFIIGNVRGKNDFNGQLQKFANLFDIYPSIGITQKKNIVLGTVSVESERPHAAFESKELIVFLLYFLQKILENAPLTSQDNLLFQGVSQLWNSHHKTKSTIGILRQRISRQTGNINLQTNI